MSVVPTLVPNIINLSPLNSVKELLGNDVVLLPIPSGQKRPTISSWPSITIERMSDPAYLAQFTGNIGVVLGEASGSLCSIDVDCDEDLEAFRALNPQFQETLQTRGVRGGNIWFRVVADYPKLTKIVSVDGEAWGEFRSTGGQTIVHGVHPSGVSYQRLVDRCPMEVAFDSIIWPDDLVLPWLKSDYDLLVEKEGEPFQYDDKNRPILNEPAIASKFAVERLTLYEMGESNFYQYDHPTGLWSLRTDDQIKNQFSNDLKQASDDLADTRLLSQRTNPRLTSLTACLKGQVGRRDIFEKNRSLIHCQNGIVDLSMTPPQLMTFHPDYYSRNASPISYDPVATCPRFLNDLLYSALVEDDISLIQRVGGAMLLGTNSAQRFLLLTGTAGGGKSTLVTIIEKLVGLQNVTELRTEHLGGRFETYAFLGKTLLTGKDVPSDFLQQKGTHKIKALVGGDYQQCEKKGGAQFQIKGDFNMVITCNSRLRVRMDDDLAAWYRRIMVINYDRPKPETRISDFADKLMEAEGSGILNFFIEGAIQHLEELRAHGDFRLSPCQERRVTDLMRESESVRHFIESCVVTSTNDEVTNSELYAGYYAYCARNTWKPGSSKEFNGKLPGLMLELRHAHEAHDIMRGTNQRGYRRIAIQQEAQ
jgi:P4 family phage/plasmid primase-like protien